MIDALTANAIRAKEDKLQAWLGKRRSYRPEELPADVIAPTNEERSVAGLIPALLSYVETVGKIPDLQSILLKVLSKPSLWSMVRNLGVNETRIVGYGKASPVSLDRWDLPSGSTNYTLPIGITLNDHHALDVSMISAPARPPCPARPGTPSGRNRDRR